jgi:hypothetical protein
MAVAPRDRGAALGDQAPHLFLSHSSRDKAWVSTLALDLNLLGVDVWFDEWELRVGDDLHDRIADAIDKSRFVGVVVTPHFSESKWIKGEVHQALSREKSEDRVVVLPLLAGQTQPPPVLSSKKFLDFSGDYFGSLAQLVGVIREIPPGEIDAAMRTLGPPRSLHDCLALLRDVGYTPLHVVGKKMLAEIEHVGGVRDGDIVRFDPDAVLDHPEISRSLREYMMKLAEAGV